MDLLIDDSFVDFVLSIGNSGGLLIDDSSVDCLLSIGNFVNSICTSGNSILIFLYIFSIVFKYVSVKYSYKVLE